MTPKPEDLSKFLEKSLHDLGEHFEHVQILLTRTIDGQTHTVFKGTGNWHARFGMAHEFINKDLAQEIAVQLAEKINPSDSCGS